MPKLETMTVGELKAYLAQFPDSAKVGFSYPSGDYWRTELVGTVRRGVLASAEYNARHQCFRRLPEEEAPEGEPVEILILE